MPKRVNFDTLAWNDWALKEIASAILCDWRGPKTRQGMAAGYRTTTGASSARIFRKSSSDGRSACPYCRPLGHSLWEVRSNLTDGKIGRVIFSIVEGEIVLLHGFVKKSQKTPPQEIDLALKRKRELE